MSSEFTLGGTPSSIRTSARVWSGFSTSASTASSDIRLVDAGEFVGDEGDTYRGKVNDDLPPRLDTTSEAWGIVATALSTYADKLEDYQERLAGLKTQYDNQVEAANNAQTRLEGAEADDRSEASRRRTARLELEPGQRLPASTYVSQTSGARTALTEANGAVQDTLAAARTVKSEHRTAVDACCREIDRAKEMRFEKPPGFWGKLKNSVCDWIADHADILKKISGVLKVISAIAGVLSFIPVLAPIMGPIALVTGGAALAIDVGIKLATGEGSWLAIGIDAVTMVLPGAGKLIGKGLKGTKVANVAGKAKSSVTGSKAVTALRNSPALTKLTSGISKANNAFEKFALKVPGVRAANVRAGRIPTNSTPKFNNADEALNHARPRLQHEADRAWNSATVKSDPAYFRNPNAHGPRTRSEQYAVDRGKPPTVQTQGTWAHTDLEHTIINRGDDILPPESGYRLRPEVSYGPGGEVPRGTPGSDRPDIVMEGQNPSGGWTPEAAVDLKTGAKGIEDSWRNSLSQNSGIPGARIEELRPGGGPAIAPTPGGGTSSSGGTAAWATPVLPMPSVFSGGQ